MKRSIVLLLALYLVFGALLTGSALAEAAEPTGNYVDDVVAICAAHGVDASLHDIEQNYAVYTGVEATSHRTVCDTVDGERDSSFQIIVDDYADAEVAAEEFRLMVLESVQFAEQSNLMQTLLDEETSYASYMDAYGSQSNVVYFALCDHYIVSVVAIPKEQFAPSLAVIEDIEALTAQYR